MNAMFWPVSDILCAVQTLLVMAVGALMTIHGQITLGTYIAVNGMVARNYLAAAEPGGA